MPAGGRRVIAVKVLARLATRRDGLALLRRLLAEGATIEDPATSRYQPPPYQPSLWLRACDEVRCRVGPSLFAIRCADRQTARWPSGARKGAPKHLECIGCELGRMYMARMPWHVPPKDSQPAEVASRAQRMAKMQGKAERLLCADEDRGHVADPFAEAASLTPDDRALP